MVGFGLTMVGPTLLHQDQRAGGTPPSDRAATCAGVRATRARGGERPGEPDHAGAARGGGLVITGPWTSCATLRWIFALVRTSEVSSRETVPLIDLDTRSRCGR